MSRDNVIFSITGNLALLKNKQNAKFLFETEPEYHDDFQYDIQMSNEISNGHIGLSRAKTWRPKPRTCLRVTTDHYPGESRLEFIIGRNPEECDIVIDSEDLCDKHLAIQINLQHRTLLFKNLEPEFTPISCAYLRESMYLRHSQVFVNHERAKISISDDISFSIERDDDPFDWVEYCNRLLAIQPAVPRKFKVHRQSISSVSGKSLPMYYRKDSLGQGASGIVYCVIERHTGDVFAMKEFETPMRPQEKNTLMSLHHDHIVRYVGFEEAVKPQHLGDFSCEKLIMEYANGPNLDKVLNIMEPLTMDNARNILQQLLDAVAYLHSKKVTHRDIKPTNIVLVTRDPIYIKLVDFGFAADKSIFKTSCGTRYFYAPEIFADEDIRKCTNKVDIFSIGVVVLRLLGERFGLMLRNSYTVKQCYDEVMRRLAELNAVEFGAEGTLRPLLLALAGQMLEEDPTRRPTAQECLGHAFFTCSPEPQDLFALVSPTTIPVFANLPTHPAW